MRFKKRVYSFECLEQKLALDGATSIPPPIGQVEPIGTTSPSPTDLIQAQQLADQIMTDVNSPLYTKPPASALPPMVIPTSPVVLGSYGGPATTVDPIATAAMPFGPVSYPSYYM